MATIAGTGAMRISFWPRMTIGISLFIVFAFAQFALRGMVPYAKVPAIFHIHGMVMLTWLALLVTQSLLPGRGAGLALHRRLGWASAVLLPAITVLASLTCVAGLRSGIYPPFFTPAYFLALVHVSVIAFAAIVMAGVTRRGQADWHKRLMVGSTILLMEPALGRVLPMPFIAPWGGWLEMAVQLGVALLMVRQDRRQFRRIHPATGAVILAIVLSHVVVELLAISPGWIAFANSVARA